MFLCFLNVWLIRWIIRRRPKWPNDWISQRAMLWRWSLYNFVRSKYYNHNYPPNTNTISRLHVPCVWYFITRNSFVGQSPKCAANASSNIRDTNRYGTGTIIAVVIVVVRKQRLLLLTHTNDHSILIVDIVVHATNESPRSAHAVIVTNKIRTGWHCWFAPLGQIRPTA